MSGDWTYILWQKRRLRFASRSGGLTISRRAAKQFGSRCAALEWLARHSDVLVTVFSPADSWSVEIR